jgi:hypothetical protein
MSFRRDLPLTVLAMALTTPDAFDGGVLTVEVPEAAVVDVLRPVLDPDNRLPCNIEVRAVVVDQPSLPGALLAVGRDYVEAVS